MVQGKLPALTLSTRSRMLTRPQFGGGKGDAKEETGEVPEEWLQSDIKQGIGNSDVESRRKRFGFNEISSEKESLFIKFLMFFTGPILYGKLPSLSGPQ